MVVVITVPEPIVGIRPTNPESVLHSHWLSIWALLRLLLVKIIIKMMSGIYQREALKVRLNLAAEKLF